MSESLQIEKKEIDCPNCKSKIDVEIHKPKPKVVLTEENKTEIRQENKEIHTHNESKQDPHDTLAQMLPKGVNFGKCANGNCGTKIKNAKGLTTKFKACPNCRANTVPKNNDYCPTCGKEPEEWDDSDIELENDEDEWTR